MDGKKLTLDQLEILEEAELKALGLSDNDWVEINSKNILFKHLNILFGDTVKIRVEDLMDYFSGEKYE